MVLAELVLLEGELLFTCRRQKGEVEDSLSRNKWCCHSEVSLIWEEGF